MKLKKALLRWYKSFHLNYRGVTEKGETTSYRPWNAMSPDFAPNEEFQFIEIPVEHDITTIVGANESGKSHLLNAITKAFRGTSTDGVDPFKRTDLCHYAGIRTKNVEANPNIGLQFVIETDEEWQSISSALSITDIATRPPTFTLILEPAEPRPKSESKAPQRSSAHLFLEPNVKAIELTPERLEALRKQLPSIEFIDSKAILSSEIPLASLIAACKSGANRAASLLDRRSVTKAAQAIQDLSPPPPPYQPQAIAEFIGNLNHAKSSIESLAIGIPNEESLEMRLFKEILEISTETLEYINDLTIADRGYIEGQVAKWNEEINNKLNLSHFWRQDEQFTLSVNYKDGIIYFEIHDKTDSIYTFKERSSGMKFFLSYYIQAKAMELTHRNRNSVILMDEPDSALSILGQRNLLAVFESLVSPESSNQTCQLIYTTHSPYLINRNFPRRIRVVKKEDAEEGTQYIEQARARRYEPVRTALGIDSAPSLFLGADNILLEGPTDQFLLSELIRVFATPKNVGEFLDLNSVVIVSADGVGNIENVLDQSRWADEPIPPTAILLDGDPPAKATVTAITTSKGSRGALIKADFVATLDSLVTPFGDNSEIVTIEDIVPKAIYADAVRSYVERWLPDTWSVKRDQLNEELADGNFGTGGLVASTKAIFKKIKPEFNGDFDKMGVLQEVITFASNQTGVKELDAAMQSLKKNTIVLCDFIRDALAKSRVSTAKHSATQAIKRIIHDFSRLNRVNVSITALQRLFRRLEKEVAPIGRDGEDFLRVVGHYLGELEELRAAGQERVEGVVWAEWEQRIAAAKKNPLSKSG